MKKGDRVQVRRPDGLWIEAKVVLASGNGQSLFLAAQCFVGPDGGFVLPIRVEKNGVVAEPGVYLALLKEGESWIDIATNAECEVRAPGVAP